MAEEEKISPAVVIGGLVLALAAVLGVAAATWAAPVEVYTCPVCSAEFSTLEELQYHFTTEHPREPIPIEWE
ncbi:hypothetical protein ES703_63043 [subsurface metagenome]